jgi:hypothetical protein
MVLDLVLQLEAAGAKGKLTEVARSVAGPQRKEQPATYASHTPGIQDEELEYFSTSELTDRTMAVSFLGSLLPKLSAHPGAVVEVERVVATVQDMQWAQVPVAEMAPIEGMEVGFHKNPSLPLECHHAINIRAESEPLSLDDLLQDTAKLGIVVGGWFNFAKEDVWSYRSNSFWSAERLRDQVLKECELLHRYVQERGHVYDMWTIVEQVIGIWRAPLQPIAP